jgi:hypothetical protein
VSSGYQVQLSIRLQWAGVTLRNKEVKILIRDNVTCLIQVPFYTAVLSSDKHRASEERFRSYLLSETSYTVKGSE